MREIFLDTLREIPEWMLTDLQRYAVLAVGVWLLLWVGLAGVLRHRKVRKEWPPREQLIIEFLHSLRSIAIFSVLSVSTYFMWRAGFLPWAEVNAQMTGPFWFWGSVALMLLAHDAYFYWVHRWIHEPKRFRLYHRRHHRSMNPSPFTAYSFDLREAGLMVLFVILWEIAVPNPSGATGMFVIISLIKNTLAHSGFELMPATKDKRPLLDWFTTTVHHDLHHARAGYNFGLYFTWWDKWMGTEDPTYYDVFKRVVEQREQSREEAGKPDAQPVTA